MEALSYLCEEQHHVCTQLRCTESHMKWCVDFQVLFDHVLYYCSENDVDMLMRSILHVGNVKLHIISVISHQ